MKKNKQYLLWRTLFSVFLLSWAQIVFGQETIKVSGTVIDSETNETLIGVTIQEVGTNNYTVTDVDGHFTIYNVAGMSAQLKFTYVGFREQVVSIPVNRVMYVQMLADKMQLDEVVVIGYGSQKKESIVGSIATIKPTTLVQNTTRSITNGLAGQVAGIIAVQKNGEPGNDTSNFWIRGINTFGANSSPLVLVDGIERDLADINPEEVESFSILKDASATAVYGVRGANGVILVKTKKGKIGRPVVTFKANYGFSNPVKLPDFVDGPKYMSIINEASRLSGQGILYDDEVIKMTRNGNDPDLYANIDWLDFITKSNVPQQQYSVDINGGSERLRYSLVLGYFEEDGMFITDKNQDYDSSSRYNRVNVRSNIDLNLTPSTLVTVSIGGYRNSKNGSATSTADIMDALFKSTPILHPAVYSNGQLPQYGDRKNPYALVTQTGYSKTLSTVVQTLVSLNQDMGAIWTPLKGLNLKVSYSFDNYNWSSSRRARTPTYYWATGRDEEGNLLTNMVGSEGDEFLNYEKVSGGNYTQYIEFQANYNRAFGKHTFDGLLLLNRREYINSDAGDAVSAIPYRNQGLAGRIGYNYDARYFAEFNFGYNGSENFKKGQKYGFFPSVALGWLISSESFMQSTSDILSKLKLRASLGLVGNDKIDGRRFGYLATIDGTGGYNFGYTGGYYKNGYIEGDMAVDNLTWEKSLKANVGLEIGFLNCINIQVDMFKEWRHDIFMQRKTIPETAGFNKNAYANFGKVENQGAEVSIDVNKSINKDWFVSALANFSFARNKVIEYDEPLALKETARAQTGHSLNQHFGLIAERLYTYDDFKIADEENQEFVLTDDIPVPNYGIVKPGDIKYVDLDKNGVIDDNDITAIGKPWIPEIIYGFGATVRYQLLDLGVFFQGAGHVTNMLSGDYLMPGSGGGAVANIYENVDDRWTPENQSQDVFWPRLATTKSSNNSQVSTWWLKNSRYLRLKNFEVGVTLPKKWQKACRLSNARIYYRGSNLLTFSPFDLWDPELGSSDGFTYPTSRTNSFGIELTF